MIHKKRKICYLGWVSNGTKTIVIPGFRLNVDVEDAEDSKLLVWWIVGGYDGGW